MNKWKNNRNLIFLTSLLVLSPMIAGLLSWNKLPDQIPIHFNIQGEVDNYGSKAFAVFAMPLLLLAIHLLCAFATAADPKNKGISDKIYRLILFIVPAISILLSSLMFQGGKLSSPKIGTWISGILLIIVGNYLPKCRQNYTVGIRLPWTLHDADNWNKTHRFSAYVWIICGILILLASLLPQKISYVIALTLLASAGVFPMIYSYQLYKKKGDRQ